MGRPDFSKMISLTRKRKKQKKKRVKIIGGRPRRLVARSPRSSHFGTNTPGFFFFFLLTPKTKKTKAEKKTTMKDNFTKKIYYDFLPD